MRLTLLQGQKVIYSIYLNAIKGFCNPMSSQIMVFQGLLYSQKINGAAHALAICFFKTFLSANTLLAFRNQLSGLNFLCSSTSSTKSSSLMFLLIAHKFTCFPCVEYLGMAGLPDLYKYSRSSQFFF